MSRVLVTGATGFIGRHALAPLAARGFEVHAVSSSGAGSAAGARWHAADLLDSPSVWKLMRDVRPTHLLHLAWYAVPGLYWSSPENFRWVQGTIDLLRAFESAGGRRVVGAGTCAEYEWSGDGVCSEANTPLVPATPYGLCKRATGELTGAFAAVTGVSAAWGRIFHLYGPHEHPQRLVSSVARSLLRGEPARCSSGEQIRDLLHVQDVADAFAALVASEVGGAVNVGSGAPVALKEVILGIAAHAGRPELVRLGDLPTREGEPPVLVARSERINHEVGWSPRFSLEAGLRETVEWWRAHL